MVPAKGDSPMTSAERFFPHVLHLVLVGSLQTNKQFAIDGHTHRIHGAGIYANIWGIWMVNVTIYSSTMDPMGTSVPSPMTKVHWMTVL